MYCPTKLNNVYLLDNGDLYVSGSYYDGLNGYDFNQTEVGIETTYHDEFDQKNPVLMFKNVQEVKCGSASVMFLDQNNLIYGFGANYFGELATGNAQKQSRPVYIGFTNVIDYYIAHFSSTIIRIFNGDGYKRFYIAGSNGASSFGTESVQSNYFVYHYQRMSEIDVIVQNEQSEVRKILNYPYVSFYILENDAVYATATQEIYFAHDIIPGRMDSEDITEVKLYSDPESDLYLSQNETHVVDIGCQYFFCVVLMYNISEGINRVFTYGVNPSYLSQDPSTLIYEKYNPSAGYYFKSNLYAPHRILLGSIKEDTNIVGFSISHYNTYLLSSIGELFGYGHNVLSSFPFIGKERLSKTPILVMKKILLIPKYQYNLIGVVIDEEVEDTGKIISLIVGIAMGITLLIIFIILFIIIIWYSFWRFGNKLPNRNVILQNINK